MSEKHLELTLVWVPRAVTQALMPSDNPLPDVHVQPRLFSFPITRMQKDSARDQRSRDKRSTAEPQVQEMSTKPTLRVP